MSKKRIAVVPGDGIGKEVIPAAVKVVEATGAAVEFTAFDWGADRYLKDGTTIPADGFAMLARDFDAILVGAFGDPRVPTNIHAKEILLGMRFKMDLYANVRPVKLLDESLCPLKGMKPEDVDFVVIRENTEGVYVDAGGVFKQGTADEIATQEDINTRKGVERVIRYAFEFARTTRPQPSADVRQVERHDLCRRPVAAGLQDVAAEYPEIQTQHMYVDALCMQMVRDPRPFDVIVTNNMFGDIITDLAAALQGGLGMAASGNIHPGKTSMFEPVHGSAPPLAGKNVANPMGAILTAAMMLAHLGFAPRIRSNPPSSKPSIKRRPRRMSAEAWEQKKWASGLLAPYPDPELVEGEGTLSPRSSRGASFPDHFSLPFRTQVKTNHLWVPPLPKFSPARNLLCHVLLFGIESLFPSPDSAAHDSPKKDVHLCGYS